MQIHDQNDRAKGAINIFQNQFSKDHDGEDYSILDEIPVMITSKQNEKLINVPNMIVVKEEVIGLNRNSVTG